MIVAIALGVLAPRVETALSGAGWESTGSESVAARQAIDRDFGGAGSYALQVVVHSDGETVADPAFKRTMARAERTLAGDPRVAGVVPPERGSRFRPTATPP